MIKPAESKFVDLIRRAADQSDPGAKADMRSINNDNANNKNINNAHDSIGSLTHDHIHGHDHVHTHTEKKAILNRLSKAIGHLESVKRMVENDRDCSEVLIQLSAVKAAINSTAKVILKDHIEHCIVDAVHSDDWKAIEDLNKAIDQFIR